MPDPVKSLTDVTEDNTDFIPIIHILAEDMVDVKQLVRGGTARDEFRLKGCQKIILDLYSCRDVCERNVQLPFLCSLVRKWVYN